VSDAGTAIRTFVAFELTDPVIRALAAVRRDLESDLGAATARALRWARPEGIHLTLKFLGATPADQLPSIEDRLRDALGGRSRLALELGPVGVFPSQRAPRVVWVGLAGDVAALREVQLAIEQAISPLGYPTERRPFSPHLTLARVADLATPPERRQIGETAARVPVPPPTPFQATAVSLMRSDLGRGGARYSRLFDVPLG
jgi:2'-5' RNA ligase